jgi:hypothetical protein
MIYGGRRADGRGIQRYRTYSWPSDRIRNFVRLLFIQVSGLADANHSKSARHPEWS